MSWLDLSSGLQLPKPKALEAPTRSFTKSTSTERLAGFLAASVFSLAYIVSPVWVLAALLGPIFFSLRVSLVLAAPVLVSVLLLLLGFDSKDVGPAVLRSWPCRQIPKYFHYEEYHEITDAEAQSSGKSYIVGAHPHGVFSYVGVCAAVATMNADGGFGAQLATKAPTAAASVLKVFPLLKDVLGIFGVLPADGKSLARQLKRGSVVLYIGGMAELFRSSPKREAVFLKGRKGFIKLALREGADVIPVYLFGNTTVLSALTAGPLAELSRRLGVSLTLFWGRFGLPLPKPVRLTYARGAPLGLPHIPQPTDDDVNAWHAKYCEALVELFERYKGTNPDYKHKTLVIE